jgi:hypothetical protein
MEIKRLSGIEKDLTEKELTEAEHRVNVRFPDQYRQFLLKYNGGLPEPCAFNFKCGEEEPELACIAYFLAIYEGESENFFDYFETYQDRIPAELIPIARDPGGNLILIGIKNNYKEKVYFWQQDYEPDEPDFSNICFIADSFNEFLSSLFDPDS